MIEGLRVCRCRRTRGERREETNAALLETLRRNVDKADDSGH